MEPCRPYAVDSIDDVGLGFDVQSCSSKDEDQKYIPEIEQSLFNGGDEVRGCKNQIWSNTIKNNFNYNSRKQISLESRNKILLFDSEKDDLINESDYLCDLEASGFSQLQSIESIPAFKAISLNDVCKNINIDEAN